MKIKDIYAHYAIPKNLQEHMLRVTRVGMLITDNWNGQINRKLIVNAALVHDLANIVKFKVEEGTELALAKKEMIRKYGGDDHLATEKMLRELKSGEEIIELVQKKSFGNVIEVANGTNWPLKVLLYADMRVAPSGVTEMETRLKEAIARIDKYKESQLKEKLLESARVIEKQIQEKTYLDLKLIADDTAATGWPELLNRDI